jgi:dolichol-phosphate mannosyltransferase
MWREWGRSIDLKDAASRAQQWRDVLIVVCAQGLTPLLALALWAFWPSLPASPARDLLTGLTAALLAIRLLLQVALRGSYQRRGLSWWLSPLADPLAAVRMVLSSVRRPTRWRTRTYDAA